MTEWSTGAGTGPPLLAFTVPQPGKHRHSRKPPLVSEAPARQIAFVCTRPHNIDGELEKRSSVLEREHLVGAHAGNVRDLDSANRNRTSTRQSIGEELTDDVLFVPPGRAGQAVEGSHLRSRQSHE